MKYVILYVRSRLVALFTQTSMETFRPQKKSSLETRAKDLEKIISEALKGIKDSEKRLAEIEEEKARQTEIAHAQEGEAGHTEAPDTNSYKIERLEREEAAVKAQQEEHRKAYEKNIEATRRSNKEDTTIEKDLRKAVRFAMLTKGIKNMFQFKSSPKVPEATEEKPASKKTVQPFKNNAENYAAIQAAGAAVTRKSQAEYDARQKRKKGSELDGVTRIDGAAEDKAERAAKFKDLRGIVERQQRMKTASNEHRSDIEKDLTRAVIAAMPGRRVRVPGEDNQRMQEQTASPEPMKTNSYEQPAGGSETPGAIVAAETADTGDASKSAATIERMRGRGKQKPETPPTAPTTPEKKNVTPAKPEVKNSQPPIPPEHAKYVPEKTPKPAADTPEKILATAPAIEKKSDAPTLSRSHERIADKLSQTLPEFNALTFGQKLLVIQGMESEVLGHIKETGRKDYENLYAKPDPKNPGRTKVHWLNQIRKAVAKNSLIAGKTREALKGLHDDTDESFTNLINREGKELITQFKDSGLEASLSKKGKIVTDFAGLHGIKNPAPMLTSAAESFNAAASELARIPYEWSLPSASKSQKSKYEAAKKTYGAEQERLLTRFEAEGKLAGVDSPKEYAAEHVLGADDNIQMMRFNASNPKAARQLNLIDKIPGFWHGAYEKVTERGAYVLGGYIARKAAVFAAPVVAFASGYLSGKLRTEKALRERDHLARIGQRQKGMQLGGFLNKNQKKYEKQLSELKKAVDTETDPYKRNQAFEALNEFVTTTQTKNGLNYGMGSAQRHLDRLTNYTQRIEDAKSEIEKQQLISELQTRVDFMNAKIELGQVNYGEKEGRFSRQVKLAKALRDATAMIGTQKNADILTSAWEKSYIKTGEQKNGKDVYKETAHNLRELGERRAEATKGVVTQARKDMVKREALQAAYIGAAGALTGIALRHYREFFGWLRNSDTGGWSMGGGAHEAIANGATPADTFNAPAPVAGTLGHAQPFMPHQEITGPAIDHTTAPTGDLKHLLDTGRTYDAAGHAVDQATGAAHEAATPSVIGAESLAHIEVSSRGMGETILEFRHSAAFAQLTPAQQEFFKGDIYQVAAKLNLFDPHTGQSVILGKGSEFGINTHGEIYVSNTLHGGHSTLELGKVNDDGSFTPQTHGAETMTHSHVRHHVEQRSADDTSAPDSQADAPTPGNTQNESAFDQLRHQYDQVQQHAGAQAPTNAPGAYESTTIETLNGHPTNAAINGYKFFPFERDQIQLRATAEMNKKIIEMFGKPDDQLWTLLNAKDMDVSRVLNMKQEDLHALPQMLKFHDYLVEMMTKSGEINDPTALSRNVTDELHRLMEWDVKRTMLEGKLLNASQTGSGIVEGKRLIDPTRNLNRMPSTKVPIEQFRGQQIDLTRHLARKFKRVGMRHFRNDVDAHFGGNTRDEQMWDRMARLSTRQVMNSDPREWANPKNQEFLRKIYDMSQDYPRVPKNTDFGTYARKLYEAQELDKYLSRHGRELVRE